MTETVSPRRLRVIFVLFACATLLLSLRVGYWQTIGRLDLLEGATDQVRSDLVVAARASRSSRPTISVASSSA